MIYTCDDVCTQSLEHWEFWDLLHLKYPKLRVVAFVIANYKNEGPIDLLDWYNERKKWVDIGVHGYDHLYPPEQERDDAEELVKKSIEILKPVLKDRYLYRPPGHQRTILTVPMLKRLGVGGIAYQNSVEWFDSGKCTEHVFNTHCTKDKFYNPIGTKQTQERILRCLKQP